VVGYDRDKSICEAIVKEDPEGCRDVVALRRDPVSGADVEAEEGLLAESLAGADIGLADSKVMLFLTASLLAIVRFLASALAFAA
jgi:hypothetical protein